MIKSVYISTAEAHCGKSLISLGIINMLLNRAVNVGVFRPVINSKNEKDKNLDLLLTHFKLNLHYENSYVYTKEEVFDLLSENKHDVILDTIINKYKQLEKQFDFIICEGTDFIGEGISQEFNLNVEIAKNLGIPVLLVGSAENRSIDEALATIKLATQSFLENDCQLYGTIINRVPPLIKHELNKKLKELFPHLDQVISTIPTIPLLKNPNVKEAIDFLNADILFGQDKLGNQLDNYVIAAMRFNDFLPELKENCLVITPGDREDIILGVLQAHQAKGFPNIAAILLTTKTKPNPSILKLLEGIPHMIPIISVEENTFETATKISQLQSYLTTNSKHKIQTAIRVFEEHVDITSIEEHIKTINIDVVTPKMFEYSLLQKAKTKKTRIVLPEGSEPRILHACKYLIEKHVVDIILLGNVDEIKKQLYTLGYAELLQAITLIDPTTSPLLKEYTSIYYKLRQHKGITIDQAKDYIMDASYFGTMMVHHGDADGMVSGAIHTTQHTIRPALQFVKTKPNCSVVSSVFFMCLEDRVLVYGDCAINPTPTSQQLAEIALTSADTAKAFNIEPKVALLSYSSGDSGKGKDVEKVREATQIALQKCKKSYPLEGPIQYDAAVDKEIGRKKMPSSLVAGQASVLIFPDLNTGNNTYKAVQRETGAIAIGPVLQGLNKPVNDLSRGCTVKDIINTVVITAIQAQMND